MLEPASAAPDTVRSPGPSDKRILTSAAILAAATVIAKIIAFGKDLLVARAFGAGDALDAFLVAFLVPSFAVTVLATSFAPAFVPTYIRVRDREGRDAADRLAGGAMAIMLLLFVALSLALPLAGPVMLPWLGSGFDEAKLALAQRLLYLVAGVLLAAGISAVVTAILQAHQRFVPGALASWSVPAVTLASLWLGHERLGIDALALGTFLGFAVESACLLVAAWRMHLLPVPQWSRGEAPLRGFAGRYAAVALAGIFISSSVVVDQAMAASLGRGSVSVLNYGNKIVSLLLSLVAVSLGSAIFPSLSRMIAARQWDALRGTMFRFSLGIAMVSVLAIALLAGFAQPMIQGLFEHGEFTAADTQRVSQVQRWLSLQIPFYVFVTLGFRLLAALDGYRLIVGIGALNLALNIVADLMLMRYFGVTGIAMATSLVYLVATAFTVIAIRTRLGEVQQCD